MQQLDNMAGKFGKTAKGTNYEKIESGHISAIGQKNAYNGKEYFQYSGRIELPDNKILLINIPCDSENKLLTYAGKGDNTDKVFSRVNITLLKGSGISKSNTKIR